MRIAILGAGVAGLSSAIALRRLGVAVSVYERQTTASTLGAGIVLWPNACYVLDQLDILAEVEAVSGRPPGMRRLAHDGEALGTIDIRRINHAMGYPSLSILRDEFQGILLARLRSLGADVHYGHDVADIITDDGGHVRVRFSDGQTITADIVIGADGRMNSIARRAICGDNRPVFQGFINWVGVCETDEDAFGDSEITDYWGVGERFGIVPVNARKAYWAGGMACDQPGTRDPQVYLQELRAHFGHWPGMVPTVLAHSAAARINKIYVHDHDPVQPWHLNNLIMIGDAAHAPLPTSGQGACQALEDAWHLANFLQRHADDHRRAFEEFTATRFAKTAAIIQAARGLAASLFNRDAGFCRTRNENSKRTDYAEVALAMARGWRQHLPLGQ